MADPQYPFTTMEEVHSRADKKRMRLMANEKIIALLPTDEQACRSVPRSLLNSVPGISPEWLADGVKRGDYQATTVQIDGVDSYQLFWNKNLEGLLHISAAIALTGKDQFGELLKASRILAKQEGCRGISFHTKRRGLIEKLLKHGGEISGVTCYIE